MKAAFIYDPVDFFVISDKILSEVVYAYCLLLHRPPDGQGRSDYTAARRAGLSSVDMLSAIVESSEFAKYHLSEPSDATFLTHTYRTLLKHDPDWVSFLRYLKQLSDGQLSRRNIVESMIRSHEFRAAHKAFFNSIANFQWPKITGLLNLSEHESGYVDCWASHPLV